MPGRFVVESPLPPTVHWPRSPRVSMEITNVKVTTVDDPSLKAIATLTFDACFVVKGIKVVLGKQGLFVAMPSRKLPDGTYQDVAYPRTRDMSDRVRSLILERYHTCVTQKVKS